MRILWSSNALWAPTGYGNQTALFVPRLQRLGHEVVVMATYGLHGAPLDAGDLRILPGGRDAYGNDVLAQDAKHERADVVITLLDAWIFQPVVTRQFRWCPWLPVDHETLPPRVAQALGPVYQPIAYSRFGERMLTEAGHKPLYVPHGVDTNVFKPMDRAEARDRLEMPQDAFIVGMVAANKSYPARKAFDQNLRAFARLHEKHPDVMFYLHTDPTSASGEQIRPIVDMAGIPRERVMVPDSYRYDRGLITPEQMATTYAAMDVLTNATRGEGFGIPIIEAQACGTPVIVTDATAMPELVGAGWTVPVDEDDKYYSHESYQWTPKVSLVYEQMEAAYQLAEADRAAMRQRARDAMVREYDADVVAERYWGPAMAAIGQRIAQDNGRQKAVVVPALRSKAVTDAA